MSGRRPSAGGTPEQTKKRVRGCQWFFVLVSDFYRGVLFFWGVIELMADARDAFYYSENIENIARIIYSILLR